MGLELTKPSLTELPVGQKSPGGRAGTHPQSQGLLGHWHASAVLPDSEVVRVDGDQAAPGQFRGQS